MENITVTAYRGFGTVDGATTLASDIEDIRSGKYARLIIKIAGLVAQGKVEEANRVKKQLPFRTVTANYRERRLAPGIVRYNHVITLDMDDLEESRLEDIRSRINSDPNTLGSFLSPKRHGYKAFACLHTEHARRLRAQLRQGEISYAELEAVHLKLYNATREYYEALLGVEIDGSGKDISREYFMSFDPQAFFNKALMERMEPLVVQIRVDKEAGDKGTRKRKGAEDKVSGEKVSDEKGTGDKEAEAEAWEKLIFSKAVTAVRRTMKFEAGNHDNFLFALGNKCYTKALDEKTVIALARKMFGKDGFDVEVPLHNAYTYTDKTTEAATAKEEKSPQSPK